MALVPLRVVLDHAAENDYGVAAFNVNNMEQIQAIMMAAEETDSPVIIQASAKTIKYYSHRAIIEWMREIAGESPVPVVLHLDHGKDLEMIKKCIEMGWTSVMIDASDHPFEKNLELTRGVVDLATKAGVAVEAEIGQIKGVEDDMVVEEHESHLTDPAEAERFCRELDLSAFAAAIGTAHGYYKGEPKVEFGLIEEINKRTNTPMALHGGTGLSDEVIQRCIKLGCSKINISTNLKHVFIDSFVDYHRNNPKDYEPLRVLDAQFDALKALFKEKIEQFGGANRGSELLAKVA